MSEDAEELSVSEARDHFSEIVNLASYGGRITYVTRGRRHHRAAAIVPAALIEEYESMLDEADGREAQQRLADLQAGRETAVPAAEAARMLDL